MRKNTKEVIMKTVLLSRLLPIKGNTLISQVVAAVRGIAKRGPIMTMMTTLRMEPILGQARFEMLSAFPPTLESVSVPSKGSPAPVMTKPMAAISQDEPVFTPTEGGKIIFPAPKNIANSVRPATNVSRSKFFFKSNPHFFIILDFYLCQF